MLIDQSAGLRVASCKPMRLVRHAVSVAQRLWMKPQPLPSVLEGEDKEGHGLWNEVAAGRASAHAWHQRCGYDGGRTVKGRGQSLGHSADLSRLT